MLGPGLYRTVGLTDKYASLRCVGKWSHSACRTRIPPRPKGHYWLLRKDVHIIKYYDLICLLCSCVHMTMVYWGYEDVPVGVGSKNIIINCCVIDLRYGFGRNYTEMLRRCLQLRIQTTSTEIFSVFRRNAYCILNFTRCILIVYEFV